MKELIRNFIVVRGNFIKTLEEIPEEKRDEVLFGEWSLKDVVSHIIGWDEFFVEILRSLRSKNRVPHWGTMKKFNEKS